MKELVATAEKTTPMMAQYFEIKEQHKDALLLFRMGDFYELFYEDAKIAAPLLEIALTRRGKANGGDDIPMCGIPHHSADIYIQKLIKSNYRVAICEQLESPEEAKKRGYKAIVKREVTRVITPGTILDDNFLDGKTSNYLAALVIENENIAISYADISTAEFKALNTSFEKLPGLLSSISPSEIIISDSLINNEILKPIIADFKSKIVTFVDSFFNPKKALNKIQSNFSLHTIDSLGTFKSIEIAACGALIEYLCLMQKREKVVLNFPKLISTKKYMVIDRLTQNNLELFGSRADHNSSLLKTIDHTLTNGGGRLLKEFLAFPSISVSKINQRLSHVELFYNDTKLLEDVRNCLKRIPDLERAVSKIAAKRGLPRDLYNIKDGLDIAKRIAALFTDASHDSLKIIAKTLAHNVEITRLLDECLLSRDIYLHQDDFIKHDYNLQLRELYHFRDNSKALLEHLKNEYRQKTGIATLKIEYNNVLGYFIEITKSQVNKIISKEFVHRQTMVNGTRFVTEKLKELESKILGISRNIEVLEDLIFSEVADKIIGAHKALGETAKALAYVDVITSYAKLARDRKYCRPEMDESNDLIIENGRHPTVERNLELSGSSQFVANDCSLADEQKFWLITGPNMAGKSTFLRQNALIAILAHIGSFVPAERAKIGIVDRVFSRIGAGDDLAKGYSTFLVEMIETATILNQATKNSLIILDELGRGTSTYDGMAIAWSCIEYLHNNIRGRTLFSTHYHELTDLAASLSKLKCYTISIKEWKGKIIFMHKVLEGIADRSYGINVAEIAGIPKPVIERSKEILKKLHDENLQDKRSSANLDLLSYNNMQVQAEDSLRNKISSINPDSVTPKEALEILYELKRQI